MNSDSEDSNHLETTYEQRLPGTALQGQFLSAQVAVPSQRTCAVTVGGAHGSGTRSVVDLEPF